jgi:tetratricopeptide (TPR) repeat protein
MAVPRGPRHDRRGRLGLLLVGEVRTPEGWLRLASQHREAGRIAEAIAAYEAALALRPGLPNSWYNLARLQRGAGRIEAALASYAKALAHGVEDPEEVHLNRGVIYADDLADSEAAETELNRALRLNPGYVPALLNLGNLHEDRGDRLNARSAYERALAIDPANAMALARLAGVADLFGLHDALVERLRAAIAASGADSAARADLGFALGAALDRLGAYDEAFDAYAAANRASRETSRLSYDREAQERLVDRLIKAFPAPVLSKAGSDEDSPIFICGMFRSGSTLAEQILGRHEAVTPGGELGLLPAVIAQHLRPYPEAAASAAPGTLAAMRSAYLAGLRRVHPGGGLVTDKRPDNFLHIGLIKSLFPEARIVHTRRSPPDNILSLFFLHLDPEMAYAQDLDDAVHWYGQYRRLMAHWRRLYPEDIYDLDYDALVAGPRPNIAALLRFCGLPWREACLSFHEAGNAVRTASAAQVREPLYRRSSGRWRHYQRHIGAVLEALQALQGRPR